MAKQDKHPTEKDVTRPDRAADPQHEGRLEERERLQQQVTPPFDKRKVPEPPQ
jgi:hypothetical protein